MSKEMVISANPHETRVAIMEEGLLCEYYVEREKEFALVGSIYKGRVTRVLPGMQSSFVDIGLDSDAFLYVSDFLEGIEDLDEHIAGDKTAKPPVHGAPAPVSSPPLEFSSAPANLPVEAGAAPLEPLPGESFGPPSRSHTAADSFAIEPGNSLAAPAPPMPAAAPPGGVAGGGGALRGAPGPSVASPPPQNPLPTPRTTIRPPKPALR